MKAVLQRSDSRTPPKTKRMPFSGLIWVICPFNPFYLGIAGMMVMISWKFLGILVVLKRNPLVWPRLRIVHRNDALCFRLTRTLKDTEPLPTLFKSSLQDLTSTLNSVDRYLKKPHEAPIKQTKRVDHKSFRARHDQQTTHELCGS
jgi:hypothetical protein